MIVDKPAYDEMLEMRNKGMTYQQIAEKFGVTKQWVNKILTTYYHGIKGQRGKGFDIEKIVYKGIYEHFKNDLFESVTSFTTKIYGHSSRVDTIKDFIAGKYSASKFTIPQTKKICEVTGTTFEECFERRR